MLKSVPAIYSSLVPGSEPHFLSSRREKATAEAHRASTKMPTFAIKTEPFLLARAGPPGASPHINIRSIATILDPAHANVFALFNNRMNGSLLRQQGEARERRNQEEREREEKALRERASAEAEEAGRKAAEDKRKRDAVEEYQ